MSLFQTGDRMIDRVRGCNNVLQFAWLLGVEVEEGKQYPSIFVLQARQQSGSLRQPISIRCQEPAISDRHGNAPLHEAGQAYFVILRRMFRSFTDAGIRPDRIEIGANVPSIHQGSQDDVIVSHRGSQIILRLSSLPTQLRTKRLTGESALSAW